MERKISEFIVQRYRLLLVLLAVVTAIFAYQIPKVTVASNITDLLSSKHPYVKLDKEFRNIFGGSNVVLIQVKAKNGSIFDEDLLKKVRHITDQLRFFPGVDRNKVYSLAARKVKHMKVTSWGMESPPIMWPDIPHTQDEMDALKKRVFTDDTIFGKLVSLDGKAALISAEFFPEKIDYRVTFRNLQKLRVEEEDDKAEINIVGDPVIYGTIDSHLSETLTIFGLTILAMLLLLFIYTRSFMFMLLPILSAIISFCWGVGFAGAMGYNIDPLILVVPLLITARTLSHSIQFNERLVEETERFCDKKHAVAETVFALFYPGLSGIVTDAAGILIIAIIPIPLLVKLSYICFFWAMSVVFSVLFFNPVIAMSLPSLGRKATIENECLVHDEGFIDRILAQTAALTATKQRAWTVIGMVMVLLAWSGYLNSRLIIGDAKPGTPILWPDSPYNMDEKSINDHFPGVMNPLLIVMKGKETDVVKEPIVLKAMDDFQRHLSGLTDVGATFSFADLVKSVNMKFFENMPKGSVIPESKRAVGMVSHLMEGSGSEPGDFDKYRDYEYMNSNIAVYLNDRMGTTIENVLKSSQAFIDKCEADKSISNFIHFKLAAGLMGLRASINQEIAKYEVTLLVLALAITAVFCGFFLRSTSAGLVLIIPLFVSNFLVFGYMAFMRIGLNVNTLPVASIAIGIGVDYGIYLISRVKEEYQRVGNLEEAIFNSIRTTGKAITFTALTIVLSVLAWIFSSIKFQAEMGLLLSIVTLFHLAGALIFLPALLTAIKPKFLTNASVTEKSASIKDSNGLMLEANSGYYSNQEASS